MARGGYRPGAGRKKGSKGVKSGTGRSGKKKSKAEVPADIAADAAAENLDPLTYMLNVINDPRVDEDRRDRMAIAAAPFVHARAGGMQGKKDERKEKAKTAGSGKFAPSAPPKLEVVK